MSVDVHDLNAEMAHARRKAGEWAASRMNFASELKDQHAAFLSDQTEKFNSLTGLHAQLQATAEVTKKRLQSEAEEMRCTEERLDGVRAEVSTSERRMGVSQAVLLKRKDELVRKVKETERAALERKKELEDKVKTMQLFGERFCLRFRTPQAGAFSLVMTNVDSHNVDKEFTVTMCITGGETQMYTVTKCEPLVPDLDELLGRLNETNDLAVFVKAVRTRFMAIAGGAVEV